MSDALSRRKALFAGAGFATAVPSLVRAESLLDIPGDPLSRRGLFAAEKYASNIAGEYPGCRLVFANGETFRWMTYTHFAKGEMNAPSYAVAIEVATTDERGQRFITSVPIDGAKLHHDKLTAAERQRQLLKKAWGLEF